MGTTPVLDPGIALERELAVAEVASTGPLDLVAAAGADEEEDDVVVAIDDETGAATGRPAVAVVRRILPGRPCNGVGVGISGVATGIRGAGAEAEADDDEEVEAEDEDGTIAGDLALASGISSSSSLPSPIAFRTSCNSLE